MNRFCLSKLCFPSVIKFNLIVFSSENYDGCFGYDWIAFLYNQYASMLFCMIKSEQKIVYQVIEEPLMETIKKENPDKNIKLKIKTGLDSIFIDQRIVNKEKNISIYL